MVKISGKRIICIIPARGGSQRIPDKNIVPLGGKPLLVHSIEHAKKSKYISEIYVSTDDKKIAAVAKKAGAEVVERPLKLATSKASSELALLHVLDYLREKGQRLPDAVVFLQGTSPLRKKNDIDKAIEYFFAQKADSLFSACRNYSLIWTIKNGRPYPLNYDYRSRTMEQDMEKQYRENGSIYIFRPQILRKLKSRLGGKIAVYEMDYWNSFQVDEPEDLRLIEWLLKQRRK